MVVENILFSAALLLGQYAFSLSSRKQLLVDGSVCKLIDSTVLNAASKKLPSGCLVMYASISTVSVRNNKVYVALDSSP